MWNAIESADLEGISITEFLFCADRFCLGDVPCFRAEDLPLGMDNFTFRYFNGLWTGGAGRQKHLKAVPRGLLNVDAAETGVRIAEVGPPVLLQHSGNDEGQVLSSGNELAQLGYVGVEIPRMQD